MNDISKSDSTSRTWKAAKWLLMLLSIAGAGTAMVQSGLELKKTLAATREDAVRQAHS